MKQKNKFNTIIKEIIDYMIDSIHITEYTEQNYNKILELDCF